MARFFSLRKWIYASRQVLEKDLDDYETLNSQYSGGTISTMFGSQYKDIKISELKHYYLSRWKFSGSEKIDYELLMEHLWQWGRVAVYRDKNKYLIGTFRIVTSDLNNRPKIVDFIPISQAETKEKRAYAEKLEVNKDIVIMQGGPPYMIGGIMYFSPFQKCWFLLDNIVKLRNEIMSNAITSKTFITMPSDTQDSVIKNLKTQLYSGSRVLKVSGNTTGRLENLGKLSVPIDMADRAQQLRETYSFLWEEIKTTVGCDTNAQPNKRAQQVNTEIRVNNDFSQGLTNAEQKYIQKGIKALNKLYNLNIKIEREELDYDGWENKGSI